jgi:hypothetical protein
MDLSGTNRSMAIYESSWPPPRKIQSAGEGSNSSHAGSVEPDQSVVGIVMALGGGGGVDASGKGDTATSPVKPDPNSPGWTNRYGHTVSLDLTNECWCSRIHRCIITKKQEPMHKLLCVKIWDLRANATMDAHKLIFVGSKLKGKKNLAHENHVWVIAFDKKLSGLLQVADFVPDF